MGKKREGTQGATVDIIAYIDTDGSMPDSEFRWLSTLLSSWNFRIVSRWIMIKGNGKAVLIQGNFWQGIPLFCIPALQILHEGHTVRSKGIHIKST